MALVTTTALCLRKVDFSETSQILTLLTSDLGVVGAIAKGAKREKSSIGGPLDLMSLYQVVLYDRSKRDVLNILAQAELIDFFPDSRLGYESFQAVETIRELLLSIEVSPADGTPVLLATVKAMRAAGHANSHAVVAEFALALLRILGIEPVLTRCVASGKAPSGRVAVNFSLHDMGLISPDFVEGRRDLVKLSARTVRALLALSGERAMPEVDGWKGASTLLAGLVALQTGRRLKTVPPLQGTRPL